jgi:hypothetical protein
MDVQAAVPVRDVRRTAVVDLDRVRIEQALALFVPMIPGTTMTGMVLLGGMSARPRVVKATGVSTVVVRQPPSGVGIMGGKGLVGSLMSTSAIVCTRVGTRHLGMRRGGRR